MSAYPKLAKFSNKRILNFNQVFKETQLLGSGGFGTVVKVVDVLSGKPYALKKIREFTEDTLKEIEVLKTLGHKFKDSVVKYYDSFFYQGQLCILMEFIPGESADKWFYYNPFGIRDFMSFALWLTDIIAKLHAQGYVHRDLKPHNVMVIKKGVYKLIDFDMTCRVGYPRDPLKCDKEVGGTPTFIAPEIWNQTYRKDINFFYKTNDVYGLGTTLYYILTRKAPYRMDKGRIINPRYIPFNINTINRQNNNLLNDIIQKMVLIDPYKRSTAKQAHQELVKYREKTNY